MIKLHFLTKVIGGSVYPSPRFCHGGGYNPVLHASAYIIMSSEFNHESKILHKFKLHHWLKWNYNQGKNPR